MKRGWGFVKEGFETFFWEDFAEGLIDLRPVGWDVRFLVVAGVIAVLITLGATLLFGHGLVLIGGVPFEPVNDSISQVSIPLLGLGAATLTFTVGWAYLLAGAARSRLWVFLLVGASGVLQAIILASAMAESRAGMLVYGFLLLAVVALGFGSYFLLRRLRRRAWAGGGEIAWWLGLPAVFVILMWIGGESNTAVASSFAVSVGTIFILAAFYWLYLSLSVVDLGVGVGRWVIGGVRMLIPPQMARWLILAFLLLKPFVSFALFAITEFSFLALDIFASLILAVVALVLLPLRRYSSTAAYILASLSLALMVVAYALELATSGSDFSSLILDRTGIVSPLVSFVLLTLWDMASAGARFANSDGKNLPRTGRMLLYIGGLILAATAMLFYTAAGDPSLQELSNNTLVAGLGTLGLLYLVFIVWRRRETLIGSAVDVREGAAWLHRLPRWALVVIILSVTGAGLCLCAMLWLISLWPSLTGT